MVRKARLGFKTSVVESEVVEVVGGGFEDSVEYIARC